MRILAPLAVVLLLAAGCDDMDTRPQPMAKAEVQLTADGGYRLDGRVFDSAALDRELIRLADESPNEKLGRTRLHVIIRYAPGVAYDRVLEMQERCQHLGISQVEVPR